MLLGENASLRRKYDVEETVLEENFQKIHGNDAYIDINADKRKTHKSFASTWRKVSLRSEQIFSSKNNNREKKIQTRSN